MLISGIFLAVASIAAVPWLRPESGPEAPSTAEIESFQRDIGQRIALPVPQDKLTLPRFEELKNSLNNPGALAGADQGDRQKRIDQIKHEAERITRDIQAMDSERLAALSKALERDTRIQKMILTALKDAQADNVTSQEFRRYARQLDRWAHAKSTAYQYQLSLLNNYWRSQGEQIEYWASEMTSALKNAQEMPPRVPMPFIPAPNPFADQALDIDYNDIPQPGPAISGPFGLIANWLIATRSLALATICGMLGFGLLGAAISTFIREGQIPPNSERVRDLFGVIIRGFSAALVIFLSVEGGIAVFSTEASSPNPYVLFFTCMVGAVFSEPVWEWAQARLRLNHSAAPAGPPPAAP
ncbi:hypothetical protein [Nannocystis pusilla]|uniref:hypothetical protein n=1 Tax=Nannocystis pusilla TaxID=889268 RepID=UPI003DA6613D